MPVIKKVLNSSVVLVSDDERGEYIVLDKGIGYGKKPGTVISLTTESRIFVQKKSELKQLEQLLEQIPPEYLEA